MKMVFPIKPLLHVHGFSCFEKILLWNRFRSFVMTTPCQHTGNCGDHHVATCETCSSKGAMETTGDGPCLNWEDLEALNTQSSTARALGNRQKPKRRKGVSLPTHQLFITRMTFFRHFEVRQIPTISWPLFATSQHPGRAQGGSRGVQIDIAFSWYLWYLNGVQSMPFKNTSEWKLQKTLWLTSVQDGPLLYSSKWSYVIPINGPKTCEMGFHWCYFTPEICGVYNWIQGPPL